MQNKQLNSRKFLANWHGVTALMIAAYREKVEVVRYLLSVGALADRRTKKGKIKHCYNYRSQRSINFHKENCLNNQKFIMLPGSILIFTFLFPEFSDF